MCVHVYVVEGFDAYVACQFCRQTSVYVDEINGFEKGSLACLLHNGATKHTFTGFLRG
jgi:hypothetical protein